MSEDERFMQRALDLARRPLTTLGNPRVGAVVLRDGVVLSEGWHEGSGTPHAEHQALTGIDAKGATLYVNLEPCSHEGRMPPCVPQVIAGGVTRVVIATVDPDERVAGSGVAALEAAGIEVVTGVLADEAELLNAPFLHHRRTGRSYLTLKLALSQDGRLGAPDGSSRWITGEEARLDGHRRRAEAGAIMVGSGTVAMDDPSLTARDVGAIKQPLKVILDGSGRTSPDARLFNLGQALIVTTSRCPHERQTAWKERGAEVVTLESSDGTVDVPGVLALLGRRDITEVYAEGGAKLATALLAADHADRLEVYRAPVWLGEGGPAVGSLGVQRMDDARRWRLVRTDTFGQDVLSVLVKESA